MTDSNPADGAAQPLDGEAPAAPVNPTVATATPDQLTPTGRLKGQRRRVNDNLTSGQYKFIDEYLKDFDGKAAAIRAGYKEKGAYAASCRILQNPVARRIIDERRAEIARRNDISIDWIVERLKRIVDADLRDFYNEDGTMKLPHELSPDAAFVISSLKTKSSLSTPGGIGAATIVKDFTRVDKLKALEMLAKYKRMFSDEDAEKGTVTIKVEGGFRDDT